MEEGNTHSDTSVQQVSERKRSSGPQRNSIVTLCSPNDFLKTVSKLSDAKVDAVNEMGFGSLQRIGFGGLIEPICRMMVDGIDMEQSTVSVHGASFPLSKSRFAVVMGLEEGGSRIQLPHTMHWSGREWLREALYDNDGCITIFRLKEIVRHRTDVDDIFRIAYVLFALTTVLCPGNTDDVKDIFLCPLISTGEIGKKYWAEFSFRFLMDGVGAHRADEFDIMSGCILFLQLMYFDIVGEGCIYVDKSLAPLVAWGADEVKELQETVHILGGYKSINVPLKRTKRFDNEERSGKTGDDVSSGVDKALREELFGVKLKLSGVEKEMYSLTTTVGQMRPELSGVKGSVERLLKCVCDLQEECAAIVMESLAKKGSFQQNARSPITNLNMEGFADPSPGWNDNVFKEYEVPTFSPDNRAGVAKYKKVGDAKADANLEKVTSPLSASSSSPGEPLAGQSRAHARSSTPATRQVKPHHARELFNYSSKQAPAEHGLYKPEYLELSSLIGVRRVEAGPYHLRRSLPEIDVWLINFIFLGGKVFTTAEGRTVVGRHKDALLYRNEIDCLGPCRYVTSFVINYVAEFLNVENSPFWYMPTFLSENANYIMPNISYEDWVDRGRTLAQLWRFAGHLGQCQRIFVPLHEAEHGGHWWLMVVHPMKLIAEIWDSSASIGTCNSRLAIARAALQHLDDVLYQDPIDVISAPVCNFGDFKTIVPDNVPQQNNGFDCGIYVMRHMQYYGREWWTEYDSDEQRSSLLLECMKPPVNEMYEEIVPAHLASQQIPGAAGTDSGKKGGQAGGKDNGQTTEQGIKKAKQTSNKIAQGGRCSE